MKSLMAVKAVQFNIFDGIIPVTQFPQELLRVARQPREAQARQGAACVPSMFSSSEVKVFYPT